MQELWSAYDDLDRVSAPSHIFACPAEFNLISHLQTKHQYDKTAKEADSSKRKYEDAVRKPRQGLLSLVSPLNSEERVEKLHVKWKGSARKIMDQRNDYLLSLESANALQSQYYDRDLPALLQVRRKVKLLVCIRHVRSFAGPDKRRTWMRAIIDYSVR